MSGVGQVRIPIVAGFARMMIASDGAWGRGSRSRNHMPSRRPRALDRIASRNGMTSAINVVRALATAVMKNKTTLPVTGLRR